MNHLIKLPSLPEGLAAFWSEHFNERCVRNLWACETCGYEFETEAHYRALAVLRHNNVPDPQRKLAD